MLKRFDLITEVFISIIPDLGQSGDRSHLQKEGNPSIHDSEKEITISMMSSITKWVSGEKKNCTEENSGFLHSLQPEPEISELNLCARSKLEKELQKVVKVLSKKLQEYFKI